MGIFEIDDKFIMPEYFNLNMFDNLPIYKHIYGMPMEKIPSSLYWTEYQPREQGGGIISFARQIYIRYPELAEYVQNYIQKFFSTYKIEIYRVGLIKTCGNIRSHIDESNRLSCINIGIKNSSGAVTRTSNVKDEELYEKTATEITCQDNHAYLLDTGSRHEVIALNNLPRYLFTYGFGLPYAEILEKYNNSN